MTDRRLQIVLVVCLFADCWLAMQVVHEFGHVLGARCTGGKVAKVVLLPWTFSRTDLDVNPHPVAVTWAGPLVGAALPLVLWLAATMLRFPGIYLFRFFAGFCLIANGAYVGGGAFYHEGDAGVLQLFGTPSWQLYLFGAVAIPAGLWLWHRQGPHFGFGGAGGKVDRRAVAICAIALAGIVTLEIVVDMSIPISSYTFPAWMAPAK
jgi:hypothetical protein